MSEKRRLVLESGEIFEGYGFGAEGDKVLELVFNTSMVGYQEILSDPSYTDQAVVMTYPLIGNYGMNNDDYETVTPSIGAFVVREYNDSPSNFRAADTLDTVMKRYDIAGIYGVDTRAITRIIRDKGSMKCLITSKESDASDYKAIMAKSEVPHDAVSRVSVKEEFDFKDSDKGALHVVAIDCGMKMNIPRSLKKRDIRVTIVPWNTNASRIEEL